MEIFEKLMGSLALIDNFMEIVSEFSWITTDYRWYKNGLCHPKVHWVYLFQI